MELFESDPTFKDSHLVVSCILRQAQSRIPALALIDSGASAYAFIGKSFTQQNNLPLHPLTYPHHLQDFDGQPALTGNITHVAKTTIALGGHIERLFLYVTGLNQYPIVMGLPWLCRHSIDANFGYNTLTMSLPFCFAHCCQSPVKIFGIIREEEQFLSPKESQRVWELQDQASMPLVNQVTLSHPSPTCQESSNPTYQKSPSPASNLKKLPSLSPARKE